jgi:hypothetical protein
MAVASAVVSLFFWTIVGHCHAFHLNTIVKSSKYMKKLQFGLRLRPLHASRDDKSSNSNKPRIIVFDLDGCLWRPEMYELLWDGPVHSPFDPRDPTDLTKLKSKLGTTVSLIGDVANVLILSPSGHMSM